MIHNNVAHFTKFIFAKLQNCRIDTNYGKPCRYLHLRSPSPSRGRSPPAAKRPIRPRARRGAALPRPRSVQCGPRLSREPLLCSHRACRTTTLHTASGQFRGGLAGNGWVPRGTQLHGSPPLSLTASRTQKPLFCPAFPK
jgi:hypothetical protein